MLPSRRLTPQQLRDQAGQVAREAHAASARGDDRSAFVLSQQAYLLEALASEMEARQGKAREQKALPDDVNDSTIVHMPGFAEKFWNRVKKADGDQCWEWPRKKSMHIGMYGTVGREGARLLAHRAAWELTNGPIPPGMFVCHRCDNPPCVRPDHLFLGTNADNIEDMRKKGRDHAPRLNSIRPAEATALRARADEIRAQEGLPPRDPGAPSMTHDHRLAISKGSKAPINYLKQKAWEHGYSLSELAHAVGVSKALLSMAVKGERGIPNDAAVLIEKLIGFPSSKWPRKSV